MCACMWWLNIFCFTVVWLCVITQPVLTPKVSNTTAWSVAYTPCQLLARKCINIFPKMSNYFSKVLSRLWTHHTTIMAERFEKKLVVSLITSSAMTEWPMRISEPVSINMAFFKTNIIWMWSLPWQQLSTDWRILLPPQMTETMETSFRPALDIQSQSLIVSLIIKHIWIKYFFWAQINGKKNGWLKGQIRATKMQTFLLHLSVPVAGIAEMYSGTQLRNDSWVSIHTRVSLRTLSR